MRILHIGNGNGKHLGRRSYDVGRRLQHGLIRLGYDAYFFSDRDVARAKSFLGSKALGVKACNRDVLEVARNFKPDLVLMGHADLISNETLQAMRDLNPALKIAQYNVDPVFRPANAENIKRRLAVMDATFVTTAGSVLSRFTSHSGFAAYMPNPIDSAMDVHQCHARDDQPFDVFFAVRAATMQEADSNVRLKWPRKIRDEVEGVRCLYHGFDGRGEVFGADYFAAIGSAKMGLNLSHFKTTKGEKVTASPEELYWYSSDRVAHYVGNGLLTFTHRAFALQEQFGEESMVFFDDESELVDKVRYYLQHDTERRRIAANGWRRAHECFANTMVAQYLIEAIFDRPLSADYAWPTERF